MIKVNKDSVHKESLKKVLTDKEIESKHDVEINMCGYGYVPAMYPCVEIKSEDFDKKAHELLKKAQELLRVQSGYVILNENIKNDIRVTLEYVSTLDERDRHLKFSKVGVSDIQALARVINGDNEYTPKKVETKKVEKVNEPIIKIEDKVEDKVEQQL